MCFLQLDRRETLEEQISMEQGNPSGVSTLQGLHEELRRYKDIAEKMEQSGEIELEVSSHPMSKNFYYTFWW